MSRLLVLAISLSLAGCADAADPDPGDRDEQVSAFTAFVIDLIENHTADDTDPLDLGVFESIPNPGTHSHDEGAYSKLFLE